MHIFSPPLARPQWPQLFQENLRVGSGVGSPRWAGLPQLEMPAELLSAGGRTPSFPGARDPSNRRQVSFLRSFVSLVWLFTPRAVNKNGARKGVRNSSPLGFRTAQAGALPKVLDFVF